jgi:hypothetical protein
VARKSGGSPNPSVESDTLQQLTLDARAVCCEWEALYRPEFLGISLC